jgi:hypothetical protein
MSLYGCATADDVDRVLRAKNTGRVNGHDRDDDGTSHHEPVARTWVLRPFGSRR